MTYALNWYTAFTPKTLFGEGTPLEFEGDYYNSPSEYVAYLTKFYGDYMQFPPVEQRVSKHNFIAYMNE